jgi:hypothetical protein
VLELNVAERPAAEGATVAAMLTVPVKPLRPVTLVGRVADDPTGITAALLEVTTKVGVAVAVPGHVTRVVILCPTAGSPDAVKHGANSIWLLTLS